VADGGLHEIPHKTMHYILVVSHVTHSIREKTAKKIKKEIIVLYFNCTLLLN
jgi:hypothetical protein